MLLLIIARTLATILLPIGFWYSIISSVFKKRTWKQIDRYLMLSAVSLDQHGNRVCSDLFNDILITKEGYKFGNMDETISSALGRNVLLGTLKPCGKLLNKLLNKISDNHAINNIEI